MRTSGFLNTSEGSKYLLCDGSEISAVYPKLRSLMTHTPDLRDRVPQGSGIYAVGSQIEPALPNIRGTIAITRMNGWVYSGAFVPGSDSIPNSDYSSGGYGKYLHFDASKYNSIYSDDCTTVQPPAIAVNFYIKAK